METQEGLAVFRKGISKFIEFNEAEWTIVSQHLDVRKLKKKGHFAEPGLVCSEVGFILTGSVRYFNIKDGEEITGYFSFENELVSSYRSFLTREPSLNYIQALEDTQLVIITYKNMQAMLANPLLAYKMERFGRLVAEHYLICYEERMSSFITKTPEERYLDLLNTGRDIIQRMPQHYIAHFLGITPVSLSRIRRRVMKAA
jgi:CRP-like cAMP-binding protein